MGGRRGRRRLGRGRRFGEGALGRLVLSSIILFGERVREATGGVQEGRGSDTRFGRAARDLRDSVEAG